YYVGWIIDPDNAVAEYDETNNTGVITGTRLTVLPVNRPPVLAPVGDSTVDRGRLLTFPVQAIDPDGNRLTFSLDPGAPAGASINPVSGVFTWTPTAANPGRTYSVTVRVTDDGSPPLSAAQTFTITVRDPGVLQFGAGAFAAREADGQAVVTVTRTGGTSSGVSVHYATYDDTAVAGGDYTAASGTLTFAEGETNKNPTLALTNDDLGKGGRSFWLPRSDPAGGATLGDLTTATVAIEDDDLPAVPDRPRPANLGPAAVRFAKSREQYANLVSAAYQRYLKRSPDALGLEAWMGEMLAGRVTEERLE